MTLARCQNRVQKNKSRRNSRHVQWDKLRGNSSFRGYRERSRKGSTRKETRELAPRGCASRSLARSLATRNEELACRINFNNLIQELLLGSHVTEVTLTLSWGVVICLSLIILVAINPDRPFSILVRTPIACPAQLPLSRCVHTYTYTKTKHSSL